MQTAVKFFRLPHLSERRFLDIYVWFHSALLEVYKKVLEQRDQYGLECEQMRRSATPR